MEQHIVQFSSALAASFFGALAAFWLENTRRVRSETKEQGRGGNLALYNLYDYWNATKQYYDEIVAPWEDREDAWFNMSVATDRFGRSPSLHDIDLSFILGTPQTSVYAEIYLQEHRYDSMTNLIRDRDRLLREEVWPMLGREGIKRGDRVDLDRILEVIGDDKLMLLRAYADGIIKNTKENLGSFVNAYDDLRGVLREHFPNQKFIKVSFEQAHKES